MTEIGATYAAHLTHQHDRERRSRHLKIHAAIVVHLHRGRKIELIQRNFLCSRRIKHQSVRWRSRSSALLPHAVAKHQRRLRFGIFGRLRASTSCCSRSTFPFSASRSCRTPLSSSSWAGAGDTRPRTYPGRWCRTEDPHTTVIAVWIVRRIRRVRPPAVDTSARIEGVSDSQVDAAPRPATPPRTAP